MMKKLLRYLGVCLIIAGLFLPFVVSRPIYAVADPTSVTLPEKKAYHHLIEDDDFCLVVHYKIVFASSPGINIDDSFLFQLYDGATLLGSVTAFQYPTGTGGLPEGVVSFYYSATTAPDWEQPYTIRISENPSHYPSPLYWDFTLSSLDYSTAATQSASRLEFGVDILNVAQYLSTLWGVALLDQEDQGTVLSSYGETYFRNSIIGIQSMCPSLFAIQVETPDFSKRSWDYTLANSLATRYADTFIGNAMTGFSGLFSMDTSSVMNVVSLILFAILICIELGWKGRRNINISGNKMGATIQSAFLDGFALLILMTLLGAFSMVLNGLITFLGATIMGVILFLNRS